MAKYNLEKYTSADGLGFPLNFRRGNPNPLDNSSVWASLAEAQNYAATDPVAYVGQILTVVDNANSIATVYAIQDEAGTLKKVGTSPVGDESTITVAEDGTVSLFGVTGLELTRTEEDGSTTKINYQPLLVDGKLTWVEPSATTVEGLATEIEGIKTRLSAVEATVGNAEGGLVKDVADNASDIEAINTKIGTVTEGKTIVEMISDAKTEATYDDTALAGRVTTIEDDYLKAADKTALETKMATDISTAKTETIAAIMGEAGIDEKYDTLKEIADWILSDTTASAQLITRVTTIENDYLKGADKTTLQGEIGALETFVGTLPEGAVSTNVVAYIQEVVDALNIGDYAKASELTALVNRVKALEDVGAEKNAIASVDEAQFAVDTNRNLTLLDIAMGKVTGLTDALAGKVDKVEGSRLITTTEATKLEGIAEGAQVNVIDSVDTAQFAIDDQKNLTLLDIAMGKVTGLQAALDNKVDKVAGSRLITSDEATKLEKLVLSEDGTVEVSGEINASNVKELGSWITTNRDTVLGLLSTANETKLNGIESGAQVNKLEQVKVGGTLLDIVDKSVNIPIAGESLGVVKSTSAENKVAVAEDGTMEVNSLNVNKLAQSEGDTLILDGGASI